MINLQLKMTKQQRHWGGLAAPWYAVFYGLSCAALSAVLCDGALVTGAYAAPRNDFEHHDTAFVHVPEQAVSVEWGTVGGGAAFGRRLSSSCMGFIELLTGGSGSDHELTGANYRLDSSLFQVGIQVHYFPWNEGVYAFTGVAYSQNMGRGYWRDVPEVLVGASEAVLNQAAHFSAFDYRFSPLVFQLGLGWQYQKASPAVLKQGLSYGLEFGLLVHGSVDVSWSPWMTQNAERTALNNLAERVSDDLDHYKILPQLALRLVYGF